MIDKLLIASNAAIKAGEAIMQIYESDFSVEYKSDNSPLTMADKNANNIINSYLNPTGIPIISEENKEIDYNERRYWQQVWIVDPLDGTKEFIKRNGEFTVNIALVIEGRPILGVIFVPVSKILYIGNVEEGYVLKVKLDDYKLVLEEDLDHAQRLKLKNQGLEIIRVVGSRSHMNDNTKQFIKSLEAEGNQVDVVSRGSSLKFCLVAESEADIYPRFAPTMEWDTAAGQAICEAMNVKVISMVSKEPMLYNKENLLNPHFLVKRMNEG